jgi:hypothetical protein
MGGEEGRVEYAGVRSAHRKIESLQDKKAGLHSSSMKWRLFTRDKDSALQTAKAHIE